MLSSFIVMASAFANVAFAQSSTMMTSASLPTSALTNPTLVVTDTSALITSTGSVPTPGATMYPINPGAISEMERQGWCQAELDSCRQLCNMRPQSNACDSNTLVWTCQCADGPTPNLADFNQTIPYFECITYVRNCVEATDNAQDQQTCQQTKCGGNILPQNYYSSSSTSSTAGPTGTNSSPSGTSTPAAVTSPAGGNSAALAFRASDKLGWSLIAILVTAFGFPL